VKLSNRILTVLDPGGDGWDVYYKARALQMQGVKVANLSIGDHNFPTPEPFQDALVAGVRSGNHHYTPVWGQDALRDAVAKRIAASQGAPTERGNILITPGAQSGLYTSLMGALDPGDEVIIIEPYYATYTQTVRSAGGVVVKVPALPEDGFQPQAARLNAALTDRTRAIFINTPNNPTGVVYTRETLEGIAEICRTREIWLISDEVYESQVYEGAHLSPRSLPGMADRTFVVNSMSKSHAMTGWRVGWVCAPVETIDHLKDVATATTYGIPGFIMDAATAALTEGDAESRAISALYRTRGEAALKALGNGPGVKAVRSPATMYLMVDIRETGVSGTDFANRLLDDERIAVMPGESFGGPSAGHLRIALTRDEDELVDAIRRLAAFAARLVEAKEAAA
jgi:arginine:pyruvate transaminase